MLVTAQPPSSPLGASVLVVVPGADAPEDDDAVPEDDDAAPEDDDAAPEDDEELDEDEPDEEELDEEELDEEELDEASTPASATGALHVPAVAFVELHTKPAAQPLPPLPRQPLVHNLFASQIFPLVALPHCASVLHLSEQEPSAAQ